MHQPSVAAALAGGFVADNLTGVLAPLRFQATGRQQLLRTSWLSCLFQGFMP
jgi:hypothetical protein